MQEEPTATLTQQIEAWGKDISPKPERRSQTIGELIKALAKAQLKFDAVKKENENPFFKSWYADLSVVLAATQKHLAAEGLVVYQQPVVERDNGLTRAGVESVLAHSSGEWMSSTLLLPVSKPDAQGIGSAITYARRYSYQSIIGVAAEEDDDGNRAVSGNGKSPKQYEEEFDQRDRGQITQSQIIALANTCKEAGKTEAQLAAYIKAKHGKERLETLSPQEFQATIKWAYSKEDLAETLKTSVKAAKAKKKEPEPEGVPLAWDKQTTITDEDIPF